MSSSNSDTGKSLNRRTSRTFLTEEQRQAIIKYHKQSFKTRDIATLLNINPRHIRTVIKENERCQSNVFTKEEDALLIELYNGGIVKESVLSKNYFPSKAPWMIRNRIKMFKRKGIFSAALKESSKVVESIPIKLEVPKDESNEGKNTILSDEIPISFEDPFDSYDPDENHQQFNFDEFDFER